MAFQGLGLELARAPQKQTLHPVLGDQPQKMSQRGWQPLVQLPSSEPAGVAAPWTPVSNTCWNGGGPRKEGALRPWGSNNIWLLQELKTARSSFQGQIGSTLLSASVSKGPFFFFFNLLFISFFPFL